MMEPVPAPELSERLRAAGLRVTSQRLVLHGALAALGRHATADEVLRAATPRLPGLSRPTVYATLERLARLGVVRRVAAGGAVRWDPGLEPHAHVACADCGALSDVPGSADAAALERAATEAGFEVLTVDVVLHGRCAACRQPAAPRPPAAAGLGG